MAMKRIPKLGAVVLFFISIGATAFLWRRSNDAEMVSDGAPVAIIDRTSHDWGRVRPGGTSQTSFQIRNRGGENLILGEVKTSCGCTKPSFTTMSIAPGAESKMTVEFTAPQNPGGVKQLISIQTNDPANPTLDVSLFGQSYLGVSATPDIIDMGLLTPGVIAEREVDLVSMDRSPFRINRISGDVPEITTESPDAKVSRVAHKLKVTYHPGEQLGSVRASLRILTDHSDAPSVGVTLTGVVSGSVIVNPRSIEIDSGQVGEVIKRTLLISPASPANKIKLEGVRVDYPWKLVSSEITVRQSGSIMIAVSLQLSRSDGTSDGSFFIRFKEPVQTEYRVPLAITGWGAVPRIGKQP